MKDSLGDRMKEFYENRSRNFLPRRTYVIIRVDGKAFHTFTRGLESPFDDGFSDDMNATAKYMCKYIMGAKFAYVQSDEISIVLTDFDKLGTQAWFDNNIQKMASISASMATRAFNEVRLKRLGVEGMRWAEFDSRVFQIPSRVEVGNYFIWRQQDAVRNSIQSAAQNLYTHDELEFKNTNLLQEMMFQKGVNWNDYSSHYKRGRVITKEKYTIKGFVNTLGDMTEPMLRTHWIEKEVTPEFTKEPEFLKELIPNIEDA